MIDMRESGVEVRPIKQMDGGTHFNEVFFHEAVVPDNYRLGDVGGIASAEASQGKLVGAVMNQEIANFVCLLLGPAGIIEDDTLNPKRAHFQQSVLFSPGVRLGGGTDEIMRNILAEQVLGLPQAPRADKGMAFQDIPSGAN